MPRVLPLATCFVVCLLAASSDAQVVIPDCLPQLSEWSTFADLKACLMTNKVNATAKAIVLDSLQKMVPSYAFNAPSQDSPDPVHFPMKVNLAASLQAIAKANYSSDSDLQQALADVFVPLHDAHTRYNKPAPYSLAQFLLPIRFTGQGLNGTAQPWTIIAQPADTTTMQGYRTVYDDPFKNASIAGWSVKSIDGKPAGEAIIQFAQQHISFCKDLHSRVNLALNGYGNGKGYFTFRPQSVYAIPSSPTVKVTLKSPKGVEKTFDLKWVGHHSNYSGSAAETRAPARRMRHALDDLREEARTIWPHAERLAAVVPTGATRVYAYDTNIWYDDLGNGVNVLRIQTFGPPAFQPFIQVVEDGLAYYHKTNASQLIIDLRDNGGGDICLGYAVIRFLWPHLTAADQPPLVGHYDLVASPLFQEMARRGQKLMCDKPGNITLCSQDPTVTGYFIPCAWNLWSSGQQAVNNSWVLNSRNITRGGVSAQYSQQIYENCQYQYDMWVTPGCYPPLSPNNVLLLSNGLCGSTCAVTSSFIQMHGLAKAMALGGASNDQMQFWSFPGGEVVQIDFVRQMAQNLTMLSDPLLPPAVPFGASFRFAIREIYPWNDPTTSTEPLEFVFVPADVHVGYRGDWDDLDTIYRQASEVLSTCIPGIGGNPCQVPHGTGAQPCTSQGGVNQGQCMAVDCDGGYYLQNGTCQACAVGFYREASDPVRESCRACANSGLLQGARAAYTDSGVATPDCPFKVGGWVGWFTEPWKMASGLGGSIVLGVVVGAVMTCMCRPKRKDHDGTVQNAGSSYSHLDA